MYTVSVNDIIVVYRDCCEMAADSVFDEWKRHTANPSSIAYDGYVTMHKDGYPVGLFVS